MIQFAEDQKPDMVKVKRLELDCELTKIDFLNLNSLWKILGGPYAIFHMKSLKLKATELKEPARYRALDNFGWNLEVMGPHSSNEYSWCTSPDQIIIDKIEEKAKNLGFVEGAVFNP